ncbi:oxidoreductase [Flavobacterium sp.]|uniref:VPS10 domain-containing protein n=1 Tax=Flavobacterium sp. TaxID=239 RepID=UPI00333F731B
MKYLSLLVFFVFLSCKSTFKVLERKDIILDSLSIRAIYPTINGVWFGGTNSKAGFISFQNEAETKIVKLQKEIADFRSMAFANNNIYVLNAGTPANMYTLNTFGYSCASNLIYTETGEKVFYDSMYIDMKTGLGIVIGDPTEDCLSILLTENSGKNWKKIPCDILPKTVDGEAAFAASDTNVKIVKGFIYIISGGKKSRLFTSEDKGITWQVFDTPIIQGEAMTGAFSMDFYNKRKGIIVGGNYENQKDNSINKAITIDGGKTWKIVSKDKAFGYASCVQFKPKSRGKVLYTCGTSGVYYSTNFGEKWTKILDDADFYTLRFSGKNNIYLAGKNKVTKIKISH